MRFLLGCHLTIRSHLIRVAAGVVINTYKTLSLDHGMVLCFSGVVFQLWNCREMFLWTWKLRPDGSNIIPLWKLENCTLKAVRKTSWSVLHYSKNFGQVLSFESFEIIYLLGTSCWEVIWQYSFILSGNNYGSQLYTEHTPVTDFLLELYNSVCLGMSLHNLKLQGICFYEPGN